MGRRFSTRNFRRNTRSKFPRIQIHYPKSAKELDTLKPPGFFKSIKIIAREISIYRSKTADPKFWDHIRKFLQGE